MSKTFELTQEQIQNWMARLLARAHKVGSSGEVPVSAVILNGSGQCIGHGSNQRESKKDPLGHAELIALRQAAYLREDWRFNDCTLIVTLEPCPMCAGALIQARVGKVIYGAKDSKRGALGGTIDLSKHPSAHHKMIVKGGVLEDEASKQLEDWFKLRRKNSV